MTFYSEMNDGDRWVNHSDRFFFSMPRTTSENNNNNNSHPGSATKPTKKVTIKNGSGIPTIEERLGLFDCYSLLLFYCLIFFKDIYDHQENYWSFIDEKLLNMIMKEMI